MSLAERLNRVVQRHQELADTLAASGPVDPEAFAKASKEYSDLTPIVAGITELQRAEKEAADLQALVGEAAADAEMKTLAEEELRALKGRVPELERKLKLLLLPPDAADERNAIVEVRAGTGGEEASLFAAELFRMYLRYSELRRWRTEILGLSETGLGGYKEASMLVNGRGVFARLKFESGVHRVQRVPATEGSGRVHTSAATVAVLPEAQDVDVKIEPQDLRIDVFRSGGPGGQSVNTTDSAVRITHLPTNTVVQQQDQKSQLQNKIKAMSVLRSRILDKMIADQEAARAKARKAQVGTGDRSAKIRTYNYPQSRVTDHRINFSVHNLPATMDGDLDELVKALRMASREEAFGR